MSEEQREPLDEQEEVAEQEDAPAEEPEELDTKALLEEREAHQESLAREKGWKPLEEFVKDGGDVKDWRPAGEYNQVGEIINLKRDFEKGYQNKAARLEKLYKAQSEAKIKELEGQLEKAVEGQDVTAVRNIQNQMTSIQAEQHHEPPPTDPVLDDWNAKNTWINDTDDPKAVFARTKWAEIAPRSTSTEAALEQLERVVNRAFPAEKKHVPGGEKGKNKGFSGRGSKISLTWDDLTEDERSTYRMTKAGWKDEQEYLKAVADDRKVQQRG